MRFAGGGPYQQFHQRLGEFPVLAFGKIGWRQTGDGVVGAWGPAEVSCLSSWGIIFSEGDTHDGEVRSTLNNSRTSNSGFDGDQGLAKHELRAFTIEHPGWETTAGLVRKSHEGKTVCAM